MAMALPSTSDKKPSAADFDSIIRLKVGKDEQVFEIYKGIMKFYSGYFRSAIENIENGRFKEAEENIITLPEEEPETFKLFKDWLYTRELPKDLPRHLSSPLIKLWSFGDRRAVPLLQNEAIDALQRFQCRHYVVLNPTETSSVYDNTATSSALRRFLVCSYGSMRRQLYDTQNPSSKYPEEFLADLAEYVLSERPSFDPGGFAQRDMCEWHVHEEGVRCKEG